MVLVCDALKGWRVQILGEWVESPQPRKNRFSIMFVPPLSYPLAGFPGLSPTEITDTLIGFFALSAYT